MKTRRDSLKAEALFTPPKKLLHPECQEFSTVMILRKDFGIYIYPSKLDNRYLVPSPFVGGIKAARKGVGICQTRDSLSPMKKQG